MWKPTKFHRKIAEVLQQAVSGEGCKRWIICTPPQNGKSRLTCIDLTTWFLGHNPRKHVVIASYGLGLAESSSVAARERFKHPMFQRTFPKARLSRMRAKADYWATESWGTFRAIGVEGGLTGKPADLIIIDDPFKNYAEAHSEAQREAVWNWFQSVVMTRINPQSIIIVIQTRWHVDDLAGRLLSEERQATAGVGAYSERYELLEIPALCDKPENDALGRQLGESSWPEKFPSEFYQALEKVTLAYIWSAMYQQKPTKMGGNYCNPDDLIVIDRDQVPAGLRWARGWDLACTEDKKNDSTVGIKAAFGPPANWRPHPERPNEAPPQTCLYLADMVDFQFEWPKARTRIGETAQVERIETGIEAVAGFKTAYQNLREVLPMDIPLREIGVDKDKITRALPWFTLMHNKSVYVVRGDWIVRYKAQLQSFPNGDHDDMVDATSIAHGMVARPILFGLL